MSKNLPTISCIILSCDSHKKWNSVLHCLTSVFYQDLEDFEVILVENSHEKRLTKQIENQVARCNERREKPIKFTLLNNAKSLTPGKARNAGVKKSSGEVLIFLEDDTILLQLDAFRMIRDLSSQFDHGYGAKRLWTKQGWFGKYSKKVLADLENHSTKLLQANLGKPPAKIRGHNQGILENWTFIANFGFCRRSAFEACGEFPDLKGYGFEDDFLMSHLYEKKHSLALLKEIAVGHVTHPISKTLQKNRTLLPYFSNLVKRGYFWFHIDRILAESHTKREDILQPLQGIHYDLRLENSYGAYEHSTPMDLAPESKDRAYWAKNNRYSRLKFAQLMYVLQYSKNLDGFVKESRADFDNLAAALDAALMHEIVSISKKGAITPRFTFKYTLPYVPKEHGKSFTVPSPLLNQFPCDPESRKRRYNFFKARYPFCEYLRFALIGDDDFVSSEFVDDFWAWPVVIEKDPRIVKAVKGFSDRFAVLEEDIADLLDREPLQRVQTFMTDPPYTLHGALAFIAIGLHMLVQSEEEKELYVVLNPTMMGKHLDNVIEALTENGVFLREVIPNFSQYKLPKHYAERTRANEFLQSKGINTSALDYSSSSNLYVFVTYKPNVDGLRKMINQKELYRHYLS